jgi:sugar phosphate isomerase/epimerase
LRLSFSHRLQTESDIRSIQTLEDKGFSCCEIFFADRESLGEHTLKMIDEVSATTNLLLTAHLPYKNINIASVYPFVWESSTDILSRIIDDVADYVQIVTLHTGYASPSISGSMDKAMENNILALTKICDRASQYDIMVGVENAMNERFLVGKTYSEMEQIFNGVARGNLGLTLDLGHAHLTGNIDDYLDRKEYIIQIHAHDNFGYSDEHLVLGEGKINWGAIYDRIKGIDCPFVIENRTIEDALRSLKYIQGISSESGTSHKLNQLLAEIRRAKSPRELLSVNNEMIMLSESELKIGGTGSMVNHIVTSCREAMTCRVADIVLKEMESIMPSAKFAILATGSFGREEMSVESDQDTIIVLDNMVDENARKAFSEFSSRIVEGLASAGFERCRGNMMMSNPKWRGTTSELLSHLENTSERSVILDARYIYGDRPLSNRFLKTLHYKLHTDPYYAIELAISAINAEVGLEGDSLKIEYFADAEDAFNIKKYGFRIYSTAIKALAVKYGITRTNVADRLWKLHDLEVIDKAAFKRYMFAYDQLSRVMMLGYVNNIKRGVVSNEFVQPYLLSKKDRDGLKEALRIVKELQSLCSSQFAISKSML